MARIARPWFWEERGGWYVNIHGRRQHLGDHPAGSTTPRKIKGRWNTPPAILHRFHELMAQPEPVVVRKCRDVSEPNVAEVLDNYLGWCQINRAPRTYEWYSDFLQSFYSSLADRDMPVSTLKPLNVIEWVDKHTQWSQTTKRMAIIAVQRAFNWADELGYIAASPIKKIKKPPSVRRDNPMTPRDFAAILALVKDNDPFHDLLMFAWHTGCRPQEVRQIEVRHVVLESTCVVIPKEEAKGKRRPRIILLHGPALEIAIRLMAIRTEGNLFLNSRGRPWNKFAIGCRFDRLAKKLGKRFALYDARHGFCQRLLENGANHLAVAELMGHANGQMVASVYSHMNRATAHLRDTLRNAADV
jgi:integrase